MTPAEKQKLFTRKYNCMTGKYEYPETGKVKAIRNAQQQETYLQAVIDIKSARIVELEAMLLYILNRSDHQHDVDTIYLAASRCLYRGELSNAMIENYRQLTSNA